MNQMTTKITWPSTLKNERKVSDVKMFLLKLSTNSNINKEAIFKPWGILTLVFLWSFSTSFDFKIYQVLSWLLCEMPLSLFCFLPPILVHFDYQKFFGSKLRRPILRYLHLIHCILLVQATLVRICLIPRHKQIN